MLLFFFSFAHLPESAPSNGYGLATAHLLNIYFIQSDSEYTPFTEISSTPLHRHKEVTRQVCARSANGPCYFAGFHCPYACI